MTTYQMYRNTTVGQALQRTLDDYVQEGHINEALANRMMATFDKSINKTLNTKAKNKVFFKVEFREGIEPPTGPLKIVACDGTTKAVVAGAQPPAAASSLPP